MNNEKYLDYTNRPLEKIFEEFETSLQGLSDEQVKEHLLKFGFNISSQNHITWLNILKKQLLNPFAGMFFLVAIVYFLTKQSAEGFILLIIIFINTLIGFYQEYQSNKSMELLQSYLKTKVTIRRNNQENEHDISTIVPGDILVIKAGDIIPADCRIIESTNLVVDESSLTGESKPVYKTENISDKPISSLYDATMCAFAGTTVVDGFATMIVFATGKQSLLGSIAILSTQSIIKSNVAKGTQQLANIILILVIVSLIIIIFINIYIRGTSLSWLQLFFFAAALSITAIPSALPIVITFCLTKGAMALHKHQMIVKRLSVIEDLGSIEVFCTDKTGTLTENELQVKDFYAPDNDIILRYIASDINKNKSTIMSNSFDTAVLDYLKKQKVESVHHSIIKSIPFTYERYRNITIIQDKEKYVVITKGSPDYILDKCLLPEDKKQSFSEWIEAQESKGNRVLAIAVKIVDSQQQAEQIIDKEKYDTAGLISFQDPLKPTAAMAIKKAQSLGVQIKILSGDSKEVCFNVAQQLNLENNKDNIILGSEFQNSTEAQKKFLVFNRSIFARVTPQQKYQIINYLQEKYSVGYIGDGINDAPALKTAQVGIAVDKASPVAREAAEIILLQRSLFNIILGIEEGRKTIINTLKYIKITIASNVGNFYSLSFSSLLINYLPMQPLQLLFLDLITDFPLISISTDSVSHKELQHPFRYSMKDIAMTIFLFGLISSPFDFLVFFFFKSDAFSLQTNWFIASALTQLILIFSLRTTLPFWKAHRPSWTLISLSLLATSIVIIIPFSSWGQRVFSFKQPTVQDILIVTMITIAYFITTEITKIIYSHVYKKRKAL